jgi:hypothetical protein
MRVIDSWTGATADALRQAFRMPIEDFAGKLGLSPRTVAYWRQRPDMVQRPLGQQILDDTLERAPEAVKARFAVLIDNGFAADPMVNGSLPGTPLGPPLPPSPASAGDIDAEDARGVLAWIEATNTSDDFISYFDQLITETAKEHASFPPATLLAKVQQLHGMIQTLLRGGKQRHRQTRELLRLDADLLAHLCQLLGDVHRDEAAAAYAAASVGLAEEAGSSAAAAFSAQAQIARWRGYNVLAADLAARGLESNPPPDLRTLLAYQEAVSAAASGHMASRARAALERAETTEDNVTFYSAWSCPPARRALFRMAVPLNLGEPQEALRLAAEAEPMWQKERPRAFGTWAHFQISVASAHIMVGSIESATEHVSPVLDLPPEYRISTLAGHFSTLNALLTDRRRSQSHEAASLRELLRGFKDSTSEPADGEDR